MYLEVPKKGMFYYHIKYINIMGMNMVGESPCIIYIYTFYVSKNSQKSYTYSQYTYIVYIYKRDGVMRSLKEGYALPLTV